MNIITVFLIAIGLAIDACLIAIAEGIETESTLNRALIIGIFFGGFQAIMALAGWIIGIPLQIFVSALAPWIAFILISIVGIKMIYEALTEKITNNNFEIKEIIVLAIVISIDAFVVGIAFALLSTPIILPALIIGIMAFTLSFIGFYIGDKLRFIFGREIAVLGGLLLIGIGIFILIETYWL